MAGRFGLVTVRDYINELKRVEELVGPDALVLVNTGDRDAYPTPTGLAIAAVQDGPDGYRLAEGDRAVTGVPVRLALLLSID